MKKAVDFAAWCEWAFERGDEYILGGFGNTLTETFINQKCAQYTYNAQNKAVLMSHIGEIAHDCYGLLKAFVWDNEQGQGNYAINGCPDRNEDMAYRAATSKGDIATAPREVGIAVWRVGHVGFVVDVTASNVADWIVVENYGINTGMLRRKLSEGGWTNWYKDTYLDYAVTETPVEYQAYIIKAGDTYFSIAQRFGTTVGALQAVNSYPASNLPVGAVMRIPVKVESPDLLAEIEQLTAALESEKAKTAALTLKVQEVEQERQIAEQRQADYFSRLLQIKTLSTL